MIQTMKSQNLLQKSGMSQTVKQQKVNTKQGDTIKFEKETIKSSLCGYSDAFILVTRNITVAADNDTDVAFKIVHHFLHVQQKLMIHLLTKQIIFTVLCLRTI